MQRSGGSRPLVGSGADRAGDLRGTNYFDWVLSFTDKDQIGELLRDAPQRALRGLGARPSSERARGMDATAPLDRAAADAATRTSDEPGPGCRGEARSGMKWTADRKHPDWEWTVGRVRHAICRGRALEVAAPRLDPNTEEVCGRCRSPIPHGARKFAIAAALASDPPR